REDLAREFGGQGTLKGADRFLPGQWTTLTTGAPTLIGAVGVLDCELDEAIERHNTTIAIGRIAAHEQASRVQPLISFAGKYFYACHPVGARRDPGHAFRPLRLDLHVLEVARLVVDADLRRGDPARELARLADGRHQRRDEIAILGRRQIRVTRL